jgi:hypothetical protein
MEDSTVPAAISRCIQANTDLEKAKTQPERDSAQLEVQDSRNHYEAMKVIRAAKASLCAACGVCCIAIYGADQSDCKFHQQSSAAEFISIRAAKWFLHKLGPRLRWQEYHATTIQSSAWMAQAKVSL